MYEQVKKLKETKSRAVANSVAQKKSNVKQSFGFVDNRTEAVSQKKLQQIISNRTESKQDMPLNSLVDKTQGVYQRLQIKGGGAMPTMNDIIEDGQDVFTGVVNEYFSVIEDYDDPDLDENFKLYVGQKHLNTALSNTYKDGDIPDTKITFVTRKKNESGKIEEGVIAEGHHRAIWRLAKGMPVKHEPEIVLEGANNEKLSEMKYGSV